VKMNKRWFSVAIAAAMVWSVALAERALALEPEEILCIVNKNLPESQKLAADYCRLRHVPTTQVVALDLPNDEEMPFETYEAGVVGPVRQYMTDNHLRERIKCLLTFYGVPFRVKDKHNSQEENIELAELQQVQGEATDELRKSVQDEEALAAKMDPAFAAGSGDTVAALLGRSQAAISDVSDKLRGMNNTAEEASDFNRLLQALQNIRGVAEIDARIGPSLRGDASKSDEQRQRWVDLHQKVLAAHDEIDRLKALRWDSHARSDLRQLARKMMGVVGLLEVLQLQIDYLTPGQTGAATDNELPLLWWDYYPRQRWLPNPLNWQFVGRAQQTLMVMRLDGPDMKTVEQMMQTSVAVEKKGLEGTVAIDARGLPPIDAKGNLDAFGEFDETLRHLATVVRFKTNLKIRLDDQDMVFPPHSVKNVALYVGWYSVQNYIPGCDFNPGAVGYHIASFEMVSLHSPSTRWVRGLLSDGVVATLGPVAEPYLGAFPKPDEFFPLLLTGKLTMAEVYWKTTPMVSWMISFIGDPLYTPYKSNSPMNVEDLPPGLRRAFR
jgi:uncharacterized protein (TIGR03790 family)